MDSNTRMTRRQSYDAVLPKREKRCRLIPRDTRQP